MENSSGTNNKTKKSKRGRKGVTRLTRISQIKEGRKIHIDFDRRGEPVERKEGNTFKSYVALVARQKISILDDEWNKVEDIDKDEVWDTLTVPLTTCHIFVYLLIAIKYM